MLPVLAALLGPDDSWALVAVICGGVALCIRLERSYRWAAKVSGPVLGLLLAMLLANAGVMPIPRADAPVAAYDFVTGYLVPLAIPLLLLRADVVHIVRSTGWTFVAFHVCVLGTVAGALVADALLGDLLGPDRLAIAAMMTGSYSGGGVNFFMLQDTLQPNANTSNALIVADNFVMAGAFLLLLTLAGSRFLLRRFPHPHTRDTDADAARELAAEHWRKREVSILDLATGLAVATAVLAAGGGAAAAVEGSGLVAPGTVLAAVAANRYVWITLLSVAVATLARRHVARIEGAEDLGSYLLYVFLFSIGLPADLVTVFVDAPLLLVFCTVMAAVNVAVTLLLGRLLRLNLEDLLLCVNAALGGAPSAAAMAIARGWPALVLPGILVGLWGYVIGTPLGLLVAGWLG